MALIKRSKAVWAVSHPDSPSTLPSLHHKVFDAHTTHKLHSTMPQGKQAI